MCGIAGCFISSSRHDLDLERVARNMAQKLKHRGPDDEGVWTDVQAGLALAHRRLSILDLSPAGHQPMVSHCGRYVMVFNGEIYNHQDIRRELEQVGYSPPNGWQGHSDTEILLAAIVAWGIKPALLKAVGMFALALWDRNERVLILARDRLGEKPLYYGLQDGSLVFASELKSLEAYPGFKGEIDRQALTLYLRHSVIPAPYSIYQGIFKLPPGSLLILTQADISNQQLPLPSPYWSVREIAVQGQHQPFAGSDAEAINELERLLQQSVSGQMLSDVQLGAFLSGGIDSSTIVALMQAQASRTVQTFTIGFHEQGYNEAEHANAVASHLGTQHTEFYVTAEQAMTVIPRLPTLYDEPFADVSQIPTFLVSELTRQHVTVSLSGDGGDELFGGYNRYVQASSIWRKVGWLPHSFRAALAGLLTTLPPSAWDKAFDRLDVFLPRKWRYKTPGDKLYKLAEMLAVKSSDEIYTRLVSHWESPSHLVIGGSEPVHLMYGWGTPPAGLQELEHRMMYLDAVSYLPDDILVKVDRAAMGVSLETRAPFLDHRIVEFAWCLPLAMKVRGSEGKWLLRQVLDRHVPRILIDRPKTGFSVPIDAWLRGPLKDWADGLLNSATLKQQGFFNTESIRDKWNEHLSGKRNWSHHLWNVLMFQSWLTNHQEK